jgi:hypothetical protein
MKRAVWMISLLALAGGASAAAAQATLGAGAVSPATHQYNAAPDTGSVDDVAPARSARIARDVAPRGGTITGAGPFSESR